MKQPVRAGLWAAVTVPIVYFGSQILAAPFYLGYSFITNSASQLGSDRSTLPIVLNGGAVISGIASIVAAGGLFPALRDRGIHAILAALVALCSVSVGAAALWAGTHPLPDPSHNPGVLGAGAFAFPAVMLAAAWRLAGARKLRVYLAVNLVVYVAVALAMSGALPLDRQHYGGLLQRIVAAVIYLPPAILACFLLATSERG